MIAIAIALFLSLPGLTVRISLPYKDTFTELGINAYNGLGDVYQNYSISRFTKFAIDKFFDVVRSGFSPSGTSTFSGDFDVMGPKDSSKTLGNYGAACALAPLVNQRVCQRNTDSTITVTRIHVCLQVANLIFIWYPIIGFGFCDAIAEAIVFYSMTESRVSLDGAFLANTVVFYQMCKSLIFIIQAFISIIQTAKEFSGPIIVTSIRGGDHSAGGLGSNKDKPMFIAFHGGSGNSHEGIQYAMNNVC